MTIDYIEEDTDLPILNQLIKIKKKQVKKKQPKQEKQKAEEAPKEQQKKERNKNVIDNYKL